MLSHPALKWLMGKRSVKMWSGLDGNEPTISRGRWQIFEKTVTNWRNFGLNKPRNLATNFNCLSDVLWYIWLMTYYISHCGNSVMFISWPFVYHHCCMSQKELRNFPSVPGIGVFTEQTTARSCHCGTTGFISVTSKARYCIIFVYRVFRKCDLLQAHTWHLSDRFVNYADEGNGTIPRIATTNMKNDRVRTGRQPTRVQIKYTSNNVQCPL